MTAPQPQPPKWAEGFFSWYCRNELSESILGDLEERFHHDLKKSGQFRAQLNYCLHTIRFVNRFTLKRNRQHEHMKRGLHIMLRHHLLTTYRTHSRNKFYAAINMCGLAIGLASFLLIAIFLNNELSFDRFHEDSQNIYRINTTFSSSSGMVSKMVNTPPAMIPGLGNAFPEIKRSTQLRHTKRAMMTKGDRRFYENGGFFADSLFLEMFSFPLLEGNESTALDQPNTIVLTEEMAAKYFGNSNPMGETLIMNNDISLKVTGVLAPIPANSHLQFDFLVSFSTYVVPEGYFSDLTSWSWLGFLSYLQLEESADPAALQGKLQQLYEENTSANRASYAFHVQPLENIYLGSTGLVDDLASNVQSGNQFTIYALAIVAMLILLIASFNFMNLSIAVAVSRGKEIGMRKVLGANRSGLVTQLLTESAGLALLSLLFAYILSWLIFPYLKDALEWQFSIDAAQVLLSLPFAIAMTVFIGIVAGFYPALILSGHKVVNALKHHAKNNLRSGAGLRKVLIAFQFCISIALIAATIVMTRQVQYLSDQELGFDRENVVVIKLLPQDMARYYDAFKNNLLQNNHMLSVSQSSRPIGDPWPVNAMLVKGRDPSESQQILGNLVGYDFLETMGIKLKEGRSFSKEFADDPIKSVIISEKTVEYLGLEDPIGKEVWHFPLDGPRTIIGVAENFNFLSLHNEISPMALIMPFVDIEYLFVRLSPGNIGDRIADLQSIWEATAPGVPLDFYFMDDQLNALYQKEANLSRLISGFSGLAVVLACLGLYGLVAFTVNQRRKEVGIRKVLGASVPSLLIRFSRQYIVLIGAAAMVAIPAVQYVLNLWLESFAYRIEISWWIYVLATVALLAIALITISYQAISAALVNPVTVLRDE